MNSNDEEAGAPPRASRRAFTLGLGLASAAASAASAGAAASAQAAAATDPEAALPPHAVRKTAPVDPSTEFHIAGASLEPLWLAEWDDESRMGPTVQIVWGKEAVDRAPPKASRYTQKTYAFPTGTIRVLEFRAAQGGMIHLITSETALYMLKGSGRVGVGNAELDVAEGDAVNYPSGVLRGDGDATVILYTVTGTLNDEASKAMRVRATEAPISEFAQWDEGGRRVNARTSAELAKAPADAMRLWVRRYEFPGNSIGLVRNTKGGPTSPYTQGELDALLYVISGDLLFTQDGKQIHAVPGDAIREVAGGTHFWHRLQDSSFIAINALPLQPLR